MLSPALLPHGLRQCSSATCSGWRIPSEGNRISKSRNDHLRLRLGSGCRNYCHSSNVTYVISRNRKLRTPSPWRVARLMYTPWRAFSDTSVNYAARKPPPGPKPLAPRPLAPKPLFGAQTPQTPAVVKLKGRVRAPQDPRAILAQTLAPIITVSEPQDGPPLEQRILQHRKTHALNPELLGSTIGTLWDQVEFDEGYSQRLQLLDAQIAAAAAAQDSRPLEIPTFIPSPADLEIDIAASADMPKLEPIEVREVELVDRRRDIKRLVKRVRALERRLVDIRYNIIMHDIAVSSFLDTVLKRLYHDDIYVARVRELTRFWNSIEVSVRKRRRAYLDAQNWLRLVDSRTLKNISSILKNLGKSPGLSQREQLTFLSYDSILGMDKRHISIAGHSWRKYLSTGLYLSEHASVPNAWDFHVFSNATNDTFGQYRNAITDTMAETKSTIRALSSSSRKRNQPKHKRLLIDMLERSQEVQASAKSDLDPASIFAYALQLFYATQPASSIYWKQWEIIAPFITSRNRIHSIRNSVTQLVSVIDIGTQGGYRMPTKLQVSLQKWRNQFSILWLDEFIVELEAFIEISFLRLQSEERLAQLDLHSSESPTVVLPNQTDMEKIRHWVSELSKITLPGEESATGDAEVEENQRTTWLRIQHAVWNRFNPRSARLTVSRSRPLSLTKAKIPRRSGIGSKPAVSTSLPSKPTKLKSKRSRSSPEPPESKPAERKPRSGIRSKAKTATSADNPLVTEPTPSLVMKRPITTSKKQPSRWLGGLFNRVPFSKYHTKAVGDFSGSSPHASNGQSETSPSKYWSYNLNKTPDGKDITVHYCTSLQTSERVAQHFLSETVVGLDLEWKAQASARDALLDNVSMIQLASKERIAVFHLALFNPANSPQHLVSPTLKRLLESPDIVKVGVAIRADCTRLYKFLGLQTINLCEVSRLHKVVKHHLNPKLINKRLVNLAEQVEEHLGLPLDKDPEIRCGGWSKKLNYRQVQYAATDPYAALQLFHVLEAKRLKLEPVPPSPDHPVIPYAAPGSIKKILSKSNLRENENIPTSCDSEIKASIAEIQQ
ncbi:hypothetical protein EMPG_17674 [Blastomyces silverae]|uniref:3'-5' exonuclease domain-containing protein n=1 Tax=Blastomyces silverae TaxID=2060906 RepID=A0A0H1B5Z4_9EURO|nr:hypothetical protein EMPG_17674 [Blastomyces silverae]